MFLKHYTGVSDRQFVEQLNDNLEYQFFCDIALGVERISNAKIVSQICCELAQNLSVDQLSTIF